MLSASKFANEAQESFLPHAKSFARALRDLSNKRGRTRAKVFMSEEAASWALLSVEVIGKHLGEETLPVFGPKSLPV